MIQQGQQNNGGVPGGGVGDGGAQAQAQAQAQAAQQAAQQAALQQQIQQQLQAQLKAQLEAAAAKGQQAVITPEQIQAQAQAMVQAAAQAQAVVAAAKIRGSGLVAMNATQIAALSRIQAQAIVNARPSTALIASGQSENENMKPTPAQIETQIQLQTQALIHAHTQAQIAAGIYKEETAAVASAVVTAAPVKKQRVSKGPDPDDVKLSASQMRQQNQLTSRQTSLRNDLLKTQRSQVADLRTNFQTVNSQQQPAASPEQVQSQMTQMQELQTKHAHEQREQQQMFQKEMQDLQSLFRQQNKANTVVFTTYNNANNPPQSLTMQNSQPLSNSNSFLQQQPPRMSLTEPNSLPLNHNCLTTSNSNIALGTPESSVDTPAFQSSLTSSLSKFWSTQMEEMIHLPIGDEQDFKNHNDLPLARIKRIMKSDEDVRMISAEAPVLFAKACEMFILELTLRSWAYSESNKRRTLQKEDIQMAIQRTDIFDFLVDVIN